MIFEPLPGQQVALGALPVLRALPVRGRRTVGPWCFLDRFGPMSFSADKPMDVAPHPHIGLQTITWLLEGEIAHDDSLGCAAVVRPGGVNVMTAGQGIAHAEQTPPEHTGKLNGVQLWVALPDAHRRVAPDFESFADVPAWEQPGGMVHVFAGSFAGRRAPSRHFSELTGVECAVHPGGEIGLDLNPAHEYAVLLLSGDASVEGHPLPAGQLIYLGLERAGIGLASRGGARLLLIGGPPFPEKILMWWNFVARSREEIAAARADWEQHQRFGDVRAYRGPRLDAPPLWPQP